MVDVTSATMRWAWFVAVFLPCCSSGTFTEGDGGTSHHRDADAHSGGDSDSECDGSECEGAVLDPCDVIVCPDNQSCAAGRCVSVDLCENIECPNPGEACDQRTGACVSGAADDDGDGVTIAEGDCDDSDPRRYPGNSEVCDGIDQDCNGISDDGFPDVDADGFDTCGVGIWLQADCDDDDPRRHPGRPEICDGIDQDCDGVTDEEIDPRPCSTICGVGEERCEGGRWFCSAPLECECAPAGVVQSEPCGNCGTRSRSCETDLTWGVWSACQGVGPCAPGTEGICITSCSTLGTMTCTGECQWGDCTPPAEICNRIDDDCDGVIDVADCLVPVYLFYNESTGDHMYKAGTTTPDPGYKLETYMEFYVYAESFPGATAMLQRFNGVDHLQCMDPTEGDDLGYEGATTLGYFSLTPTPPLATEPAAGMAVETLCRYVANYAPGDHMLMVELSDDELLSYGLDFTREACVADIWGFYFHWSVLVPIE